MDIVNEIVDANLKFLSWRKRLDWIHSLFSGGNFDLNTDNLVYICIYLRFIGSGEIPCGEDGGHYRPSHHARMARQIYRRLSEIISDENVFIIRKIYPWLPSFDSPFTRAEPLTRIRDIAHRNDISGELKKEIKHTLQNKLHRSAGPEDLFTSENLLKKITAPGAGYPKTFIDEFSRFHDELEEFFNARSLDQRLSALAKHLDAAGASLINEFLALKEKTETTNEMAPALALLTKLRGLCNEMIKSASSDEPKAQHLQMADIGLEDYSFVLLGRLNSRFEGTKNELPWDSALQALLLAIMNLRYSGFGVEECRAIEAELKSWSPELDLGDTGQLIRLKATLDRCSRMATDYCNRILAIFPEKAEKLGRALGVAAHAIKFFSESDIRSHPVFQVSRLVELIIKNIRSLANLPSWDIIVPGNARGLLLSAPGIDRLPEAHDEPLVALLEKVRGDEDIPAAVTGIVAAHQIPHLSHIVVRARQSHIVFTACEEKERFQELARLAGKQVSLNAFAGNVGLTVARDHEKGYEDRKIVDDRTPSPALEPQDSMPAPAGKLIMLDAVVPGTGGGKAFAARRLEELSGLENARFKTPRGIVVPFGVMEESLSAERGLGNEYLSLIDSLNSERQNNIAGRLKRLHEIVNHLPVPDEIVSGIMKKFAPDERLMVRSSSNYEDRENLSGAGLYDSAANVAPADVASAVRKVWASLWSKRAVMNRRSSGVGQDKVLMAVLIQEMVVPDFSFIMHTRNPVNFNPDEIYIELAAGLGETLASAAAQGFPYRILFNKKTAEVRTAAFSSFSHGLWPGPPGSLVTRIIDYSEVVMSTDEGYRNFMGRRLGTIGEFIENAMGRPQDIEGVITGEEIYMVQSREQIINEPRSSGVME